MIKKILSVKSSAFIMAHNSNASTHHGTSISNFEQNKIF
jgi:hypothetical protein